VVDKVIIIIIIIYAIFLASI